MIDLSMLNKEQREAVEDFDHNLLILACAGSGKTRTISSKIAYAIETGLYKPYQICAVTFTNRAAKEMRDRVDLMLPDVDTSRMEIRTFHSLGAFILRRFGEAIGLNKDFCIYDDDDSLQLLSSISKLDKKDLRGIQKSISKAKDLGLTPESNGLETINSSAVFRGIFASYEDALRKTGNVDFSDLIERTAELLSDKNSEALRYCHSRFKLILVDEYQDSNKEQFEFLKLFKADDARLVVVGDDDQSIYSFRGADVTNILGFDSMFDNVRQIKLEKNYRSTDEILSPAAALIKNNVNRHDKDIVSADGKKGAKPSVIANISANAEAVRVSELIRNLGDYDNTAILYRTNAQSQLFEQQLTKYRIPYKLVGALRFYDREEVKDALALLYILMNHKDSVSFRRVINKPKRGLGEQKVEQILSYGDDLMRGLDLFVNNSRSSSASESAKLFLDGWRKADKALSGDMNLGDLMYQYLVDMGILDYYNSEPDRTTREAKIANLGELVNVLKESGTGRDALSSFLEKLTLDSTTLGEHDPRDEKGVTLITMHNTKGLEYDRVFCVGLEEEIIPGLSSLDDPTQLEEERRILYVAMTRARKSLYLSFARQRMIWGTTRYTMPSKFFYDIPREMLSGEVSSLYKRENNSYISQYSSKSYSYTSKPRTYLSNIPAWADGISGNNEKKKEEIKRNVEHFSLKDKVRSATYGEGVVEDIDIKSDKRILSIKFSSGKIVKFVEAKAPIEKIN